MKNVIILFCAFVLCFSASAEVKPKVQLGGGKVLGVARIVNAGSKPGVVIISCDKSKRICLYILNKIDDTSEDVCKVAEPWKAPPAAADRFDVNYPYAFSFDTEVLTFYPATSIKVGCRNEEGEAQIVIETQAEVRLP